VVVSTPGPAIDMEDFGGLTLMSWSTMAVPGLVQVVPVTAAGFTTRLPRAMMLRSSLGRARPNAAVAEKRTVKSAEVYMMLDFVA
jgi:hypothetical protein